jgi:RNA polymerase sigma factor (sigma-70 family)
LFLVVLVGRFPIESIETVINLIFLRFLIRVVTIIEVNFLDWTRMRNKDYSKTKDSSLLRKIFFTDSDAFDALYARYWSKGVYLAYSYLKDEGDSQDLVQGLFADLWKNPRRYKCDKRGSFSAFFSESIRNLALNFLDKRNRKCELPEPEFFGEEDKRESLGRGETVDAIRRAVPKAMAEIVILHLMNDRDFKSIAESLGITIDSATSMYSRALKALGNDPSFVKFLTESTSAAVSIDESEDGKNGHR